MTNLGLGGDGKRRRRFFKQRDQAEQFLNEQVRTSFDPLHGRRNEVLFSLEQIDRIGVSLHEVVAFYVQHHARKGNPTLSELVELFITEKRQIGRSSHYPPRRHQRTSSVSPPFLLGPAVGRSLRQALRH